MKSSINVEKYLKQARINEELVSFFDRSCKDKLFYKWAFVALYYSALHYFYAFLSNKNKNLPDNHKGANGGNEMAERMFFTIKDGIQDSAGADYNQLFKWGYDVRYKPERADVLEEEHLELAKKCLDGVKLVTFNEIGLMPKKHKSGEKIVVAEVKAPFLKDLYDKRKNK